MAIFAGFLGVLVILRPDRGVFDLVALIPLVSALMFALSLTPASLGFAAGASEVDSPVDLELVIAVDVSFSISRGEQDIQRRGYANAFASTELVKAVTSGYHRRIAVTYFEWAGPGSQYQVVPWTVIDGAASARTFAERLREAPIRRGGETSISAALMIEGMLR